MKFKITLFIMAICFVAKAQNELKVGNVLPSLALKDTNGEIYDLNKQTKAKGFILVFMSPSCEHCQMYESRVMALDKKYKPKNFPVVAIGPYGDDPEAYPLDAMPEMKKLAIKKGFTFPYLADEAFKYTWLLGVKNTPTAVVLKKLTKGYLITYIGSIDDQENVKITPKHKYVENEVEKIL
jgi:peroxiredoxin